MYTRFGLGNLRERDRLEDPGLYGRIILKWIFRQWNGGGAAMDKIDLAQNRDRWAGSFKNSNEPSSSQNRMNFLTK